MEDFDDPLEAVDEFFNCTAWYVLRAVDAEWDQLGYVPEPSIGWGADEDRVAELGSDAAAREEQRLVTTRDTVDIPPVKLRSRAERTVPQPKADAPNEVLTRIARRLSEYEVPKGPGELGTLSIAQERNLTRTFKAHWTGFKLLFPRPTILLSAILHNGQLWSEGYISPTPPSWVLAFRRDPPKARGSGGPRPDDTLGLEASIVTSLAQRHKLIDSRSEERRVGKRSKDFGAPHEDVDNVYKYTAQHV